MGLSEDFAEVLAEHRPVFDSAVGLLFPVRCGICDVAAPGWAAWDRHLATALAARAADDGLRARVEALADTIQGDDGVAHNEGCEGEPDCLACIVLDLRAALAETAPAAEGAES